METIGVRELRQNASRYLARVAAGESILITNGGRPVARLVPSVEDSWEDLLATGRVLAPEDEADVADDPPVDFGVAASAALTQLRDQER